MADNSVAGLVRMREDLVLLFVYYSVRSGDASWSCLVSYAPVPETRRGRNYGKDRLIWREVFVSMHACCAVRFLRRTRTSAHRTGIYYPTWMPLPSHRLVDHVVGPWLVASLPPRPQVVSHGVRVGTAAVHVDPLVSLFRFDKKNSA